MKIYGPSEPLGRELGALGAAARLFLDYCIWRAFYYELIVGCIRRDETLTKLFFYGTMVMAVAGR